MRILIQTREHMFVDHADEYGPHPETYAKSYNTGNISSLKDLDNRVRSDGLSGL